MNNDSAGSKGNGMIWVAAGCGGLLILTLCVGSGVAFYFVGQRAEMERTDYPGPMIDPNGPSGGQGPGPMMPNTGGSESVEVNATVTVSTGSQPAAAGSTCSFRVEHLPRSNGAGFWCRTQAVCAGRLLFGGPTAGYFNCTYSGGASPAVTGGDPDTTSADSDASFAIDTTSGNVTIRDDASGPNGEYSLVAHIDSVR